MSGRRAGREPPTCDWGDARSEDGYCDEPAFAFAFDDKGHGWLPVCQRHYREASFEGYTTSARRDPQRWQVD